MFVNDLYYHGFQKQIGKVTTTTAPKQQQKNEQSISLFADISMWFDLHMIYKSCLFIPVHSNIIWNTTSEIQCASNAICSVQGIADLKWKSRQINESAEIKLRECTNIVVVEVVSEE